MDEPSKHQQRILWYRAKAAEFEQRAKEERDPDMKRHLTQLASDWESLAKQAEQSDW